MELTPSHYHRVIEFMTNTSAITTNLEHKVQTQLANLFQLNHSLFWQSDVNGNMYNLNFHNVQDKFIWDYTEVYRDRDIMQPKNINGFLKHQPNSILTISETKNMRYITSDYKEFIEKHQMIDQMVLYFKKGTSVYGGIGFARFKGERQFSNQEKIMLQVVSKHIEHVIDNNMKLIEAESQADFYMLKQKKQLGIIKLNAEAEVIYFNEDVGKIINSLNERLPVKHYYYKYLKPYLFHGTQPSQTSYYIELGELKVKIVPSTNKRQSSHKYTLYVYQLKKEKDRKSLLSDREKEVYDLVLKGYTNEQISKELWISINTVKKHLGNMYDKLKVSNRTALIYKLKNI